MVRGDLGRAAGGGAFAGRQPHFAAVVVKLLHSAGFFVGNGVGGCDGFDGMAGGEVGFDAGAARRGEGAGHGCRMTDTSNVGCEHAEWIEMSV